MVRQIDRVAEIDPRLVTALLAEQFPQWKDLSVTPVSDQGWDNRTFRLGIETVGSST